MVWEIKDFDNSCSDPMCCGGPWALYGVVAVGTRVEYLKYIHEEETAERFCRRMNRWGVKPETVEKHAEEKWSS